ncbi:siderophore-interacting protein [Streptomyces microflavus]|uniref:siderophore-interacting protein n=1 Tax=Streptomyces microflavus TaxID=1919 RepID=UPI0035E2F4BB
MAERPARQGPKAQGAQVVRTEQITPHMVRVVLGGEGLADFSLSGFTDHYIKLCFAPEGADYAHPFDIAAIRESHPRELWPTTRTYTVRSWDPAAREMAVDDDGQGLRQALAWCDPQPLLQGELWQSLQWLARYTHAPLGEVLSTALPGPLRHGEALPETHHWGWQLTHEGRAQREKLRAGSRPRQLAELLAEAVVDEDVLGERMDDWRTAARSLAKRELAERVALSVAPQHAQPLPGPTLNPDQAEAVAAINAADGFQPFLLDGVTGSGKSEVYLQAINH